MLKLSPVAYGANRAVKEVGMPSPTLCQVLTTLYLRQREATIRPILKHQNGRAKP